MKDFKNQIFERFLHEVYPTKQNQTTNQQNNKVENLRKVFRSEDIEIETIALDGVSFEINDGEFVAIMGPSGCGKSTLLNILGLLDNPTEGRYELLGHQVGDLKEKDRTQFRKGNIGFVFQSFNLIDELNVFENIELPLRYMNIPAAERKQRVEDIMTRMAIKHRASHFPQQLSGGQQQRVAIADGPAHRPPQRRHHHRHGDPLAARRRLRRPHHQPLRR